MIYNKKDNKRKSENMEKVDIINNFIKIFFINLLTYWAYAKITNSFNDSVYNKIFVMVESIDAALSYIILTRYFNPVVVMIFICLVNGIIVSTVRKEKINYSIFVIAISFIFIYMIYLISVIISAMVLNFINPNNNNKNFISLLTILFLTACCSNFVFKFKRLKNGFNFIKNINNSVINKIIIYSGGITLWFGLLQNQNSKKVNELLLIGSVIIFINLLIWLQSQITKHYKKNMRDRTISVQKAEIDEQTKLLEEVKAENLKLATAVHKYNHRLSSLELAMKSAISHNLNTEFADELSVMLKDTEDLSNSFANECNVAKCILPLTNVPSIDNMFKYMQDEASKCNINFDLKVNESINDLIDNIIPKDMFETLLGDHLRDAIIAVNASDNSYKSILTTLGLVDGCYELSVYDTGIEFQIDTLLKLGKEQVTTHKDSGGSGIGFITTFETLKTTKASLVIEEYNPETTNYTKSVNIRFDGKNQYRIYSYRADDIKKQNKEKRIIVKNIE